MLRDLTIRRDLAVTSLAAWLLVSAITVPSAAQPTEDPNIVAAARALAVEGVKLAQDGHCDQAIDKLERAEKLRHSSIVLEQLGECYIEKGRFVEGAEAMRSVIREGTPENPSDAMKRAHTNAQSMLDNAKNKIAMLTITIEVVGSAEPNVAIDGQPVPIALLGAARPTDPGEHTVEASAPGHLPVKRRVALAPGQSDTLALTLVVDPRAQPFAAKAEENAPAAAPEAPVPVATPVEPTERGPNRVPAYIAWGVAGAAVAVGVAYGWVAMNQKSDLDKACPAHRCPPAERDRLDTAKTNGVISTVAFGVGLGAAITGGLLFFLAEGESEAQPTAASEPRLRVGPGTAEVSIRF
jgi:tetratricopeptide (TPR) repeat protein